MSARVSVGGLLLDPSDVNVGVKQGCISAPVSLNLFLVAITRCYSEMASLNLMAFHSTTS